MPMNIIRNYQSNVKSLQTPRKDSRRALYSEIVWGNIKDIKESRLLRYVNNLKEKSFEPDR